MVDDVVAAEMTARHSSRI